MDCSALVKRLSLDQVNDFQPTTTLGTVSLDTFDDFVQVPLSLISAGMSSQKQPLFLLICANVKNFDLRMYATSLSVKHATTGECVNLIYPLLTEELRVQVLFSSGEV